MTGIFWENKKLSKEVVALGRRAQQGPSLKHTIAGKYSLECAHDVVSLYKLAPVEESSGGNKGGNVSKGGNVTKPVKVAEFRAPALILSVCHMGFHICIGCKDGQV